MRIAWGFGGVLAFLLLVIGGPRVAEAAADDDKPRNPFGVPDVKDPDGQDVQDFAAKTTLPGDAKDPNAEQWVTEATAGKKGSLVGEWSDRWNGGQGDWNYGTGPTQIKVVGDRVYMLVNASNGKYLIELIRTKDRLGGRFQGVENANDSGPCVLLVVNEERLDGNWAGSGRWDFRRRLK